MALTGPRTPSLLRGALALLGVAFLVGSALGQGYAPVPDYSQVGLPDAAAGRALLARWRSMNGEAIYLEFDLHALPRRGDERVFRGRLWSGRNDRGPITRIALTGADGRERHFLVQSGPDARVWRSDEKSGAKPDSPGLMDPLIPGTEITGFDLQMPFFYWPEPKLLSMSRIRGRPSYVFLFHPPAEFAARYPELAAVRAYLDAEYDAPVQFELIGPDGQVAKTWSLLDLKRVEGKWMVKEVDVRNEATRDKTRFIATGVVFGIHPSAALFDPIRLATLPSPSAERVVPIAP